MDKPLIGIVAKPGYKDPEDVWYRMDIVDELRYLVATSGGIAISILPTDKSMYFNDNDICDAKDLSCEELHGLYQVVDKCDGIILQGGVVSCKYEIEVAKRAIELDIPIIGICAGFNNILRAIGSDVLCDKTKKHDIYDVNYRHDVHVVKNTILHDIVKTDILKVNSIHEMIAPKELVEPFAKISSTSYDGLVESFELPNKKFVMGIKWHPELMLNTTYSHLIFNKFIEACK